MKVLIILILMAACGDINAVAPPDLGKTDTRPITELDEPDDENIPPMGGSLPLGYYERQCQWDACGGPLPDKPMQATDPLR